MKPAKIPCDYLVRDGSERAAVLFEAIKPELASGMTYLDIGCGTAPLVDFINEVFPPARYIGIDLNDEAIRSCAARHPHHTWICVKSDAYRTDLGFDVVIHTGVNAPRFNDAEIHERMLDDQNRGPLVVLIESGDYLDGPSDTRPTYERLRGFYLSCGFYPVREGGMTITHFPVPVRNFTVFVGHR